MVPQIEAAMPGILERKFGCEVAVKAWFTVIPSGCIVIILSDACLPGRDVLAEIKSFVHVRLAAHRQPLLAIHQRRLTNLASLHN